MKDREEADALMRVILFFSLDLGSRMMDQNSPSLQIEALTITVST